MTSDTLSRKDRRQRLAKAAKMYGIKGDAALELHAAYLALGRGAMAEAVQLAHPVLKAHPANPHGWMILGTAALDRREGETARAFFARALELAPGEAQALAGLARAQVLEADVEAAVATMAQAIAADSRDVPLIRLYMDLMSRLGRRLDCADVVAPTIRRIRDAGLAFALGDLLDAADEPGRAAEWLERAWKLDPAPEAHQIARLRAMLYQVRLEEAEPLARALLARSQPDPVADRDTVALILLTLLRSQRRLEEAEELAATFDFATPAGLAQARGLVANIHQDRGDHQGARDAYVEAVHITGTETRIRKAFGAFLLRRGEIAPGQAEFAHRFPEVQRRRVPLANSDPAALAARGRLFLMAEQGVGDQLALAGLLPRAPLGADVACTFVGAGRMGPLLAGNSLDLAHLRQADFAKQNIAVSPQEVIFLGDLVRYLPDAGDSGEAVAPVAPGGYLRADPARLEHLRRKYERLAEGRPVLGLAWASRSLAGRLRSVPLERMVAALPRDALVIDLQYGDTTTEIARARAARPDLLFHSDREVDQLTDLAGFAAQIAALDRVVTIDNTTAHLCGALGLPGHMLVPGGSECMWYWGEAGTQDRWYGALTLHRQSVVGDWSGPLATLGAALSA
ncbi:hypothetical protein [Pseudooceanicola aestuarii]|uniref:hypothetical protein n=1 Tax=Pseudooceanicola aestuarii TaxID=2697319 RepID=UPI0013D2FDC7|nr:hypothetical protein [Pseudooceanicola aestuarii]